MAPDGLIYVSDQEPGISRVRQGEGFVYTSPSGKALTCKREQARIDALGIPPAYEDVWICPKANGHLQATGRDARNRKQYRYHQAWSDFQNLKKFDGLIEFGNVLPRIRRAVVRDLSAPVGSREFTLSSLVKLLDHAAIRVGNKEYAQENGTYGATTMLDRHVDLGGDIIKFDYKAKGGKRIRRQLRNKRLHQILHKVSDLPGRELFTYRAQNGEFIPVDSAALNAYLVAISDNDDISGKTFRTWAGTRAAFIEAGKMFKNQEPLTIKTVCQAAADELFNTPTICRNSYIHPAVIDIAQGDDAAVGAFEKTIAKQTSGNGLRKDEAALMEYLKIRAS